MARVQWTARAQREGSTETVELILEGVRIDITNTETNVPGGEAGESVSCGRLATNRSWHLTVLGDKKYRCDLTGAIYLEIPHSRVLLG